MCKIQTKDYKGDNRRSGNALRLSGLDWFKIAKWGIGIIILSTIAWTTLKLNVNAIAKDCEESKEANECQERAITILKENVVNIGEDIADIKKEQKSISEKFDENSKILYKILGSLENKDDVRGYYDSYAGDKPIIGR